MAIKVKENREKFKKLIAEYNKGFLSVDEIFEALRALSDELNKEEIQHEALGLSEEELTIFDMLNRPGSEHTEKEKETFKKAAKSLLKKLKTIRASAAGVAKTSK